MSSEASARVALVCVMFAVLLTLCQIRLQIMWNSNPKMRKHVIRILLMVPIYAVQSYIALLLKDSFVYFDALRECYEAVVIYSFVLLLVGYLGGERHLVYVLELKPAEYVKHPFPFNYCVGDRVRLGKDYFQFTKIGALQYVVLKPLTAIASFILSATGTLGETDPFRFDRGYLYIVTINSISQALAIYCLLLFYTVMRTELQPLDFVSKAIVLKTVIFFTYWQSITFRLIALTNIIPLPRSAENYDTMSRFIDLILCVEMAGFAIAQWVAWGKGSEFFNPDEKVCEPYGASVWAALNPKDLWEDAKDAVETGEVKRLLNSRDQRQNVDLVDL